MLWSGVVIPFVCPFAISMQIFITISNQIPTWIKVQILLISHHLVYNLGSNFGVSSITFRLCYLHQIFAPFFASSDVTLFAPLKFLLQLLINFNLN